MNKHAILRFSSAAVLALPVLQGCGGGGGSTSVSVSDSGLSSIPTPAPGATTLADCYGNDVLYATGTTYETDEKQTYDGGTSYSDVTFTTTVNGPKTFRGNTAIESSEVKTTKPTGEPDSSLQSSTQTSYKGKTSTAVLYYGWQGPGYMGYDDPSYQTPLNLSEGASVTQAVNTHYVLAGPNSSQDEAVPYKETITFVGTESVTVPAGTFTTCKVKLDSLANPDAPIAPVQTVYNWIIKDGIYKGLTAKWADSDQNPKASGVATRLVLNGV